MKVPVTNLSVSFLFSKVTPGKEMVLDWLKGRSPLTPSWMNLLAVMRSSGLRDLSHIIEDFLYTVPPTAFLPVKRAEEGRGTGRGTQNREQGELRQVLIVVTMELLYLLC